MLTNRERIEEARQYARFIREEDRGGCPADEAIQRWVQGRELLREARSLMEKAKEMAHQAEEMARQGKEMARQGKEMQRSGK